MLQVLIAHAAPSPGITACLNLACLSPSAALTSPPVPPAGYLVLEGYGGPGESSTDDDILASSAGKQLRASQGCAADSGINLRFSSASQAGSLSSFSRQVLSHLRNLQANLNYLKVRSAVRAARKCFCFKAAGSDLMVWCLSFSPTGG